MNRSRILGFSVLAVVWLATLWLLRQQHLDSLAVAREQTEQLREVASELSRVCRRLDDLNESIEAGSRQSAGNLADIFSQVRSILFAVEGIEALHQK